MVVTVRDKYAEALRNKVRDKECGCDELRLALCELGGIMGRSIAGECFLEERSVLTPLMVTSTGVHLRSDHVVVVSTFDDYKYFGKGVADAFPRVKQGHMDFAGARGSEALSSSYRSITLPDVNDASMVIVAKSVLATGCTAISLARKAMEKYWPEKLVVTSVFHSENGVFELQEALKNVEVFTLGSSDALREDGMLVPGVGNLDNRLKG